MRRVLGLILPVLLVGGCGGGDDDEEATVALEPIAAVSACDLLDEDTAAELAGDEVELVSDADDPNACEFGFADDGLGSAIAASLRFDTGDESDVPGGALARALDLGDAGAVESDDDSVKVVYVVREVVVIIEVAPAEGVDDDVVDRVVEFAETTERPVIEAVTGEAPEEETTTTTERSTTTTADETTTTTAGEAEPTVDELWRRTATEFRDQIGEQFVFECPPGGTAGGIWGSTETGYTDDSSVCTAAVHAGVITLARGGDVLIQMVEGADAYESVEANGITSSEWPAWPAGFLPLEVAD